MNITVLGAGAWGTALSIALAHQHEVLIWGRDEHRMRTVKEQRVNEVYLPGVSFTKSLNVALDFSVAAKHGCGAGGLIIIASPVAGLRAVASQLQPYEVSNVIWLCKGLEEDSGLLPHQIMHSILGTQVHAGALSGPSFAQEVARGLPCALTIASQSPSLCAQTVRAIHSDQIRVYSTDDVVGVEVGGAVKNILAIATGISDGLELGLNARAALITRGLAEITRLGIALGGRAETFMGLAGVGDLILTCTGHLSRNRQVGIGLAQGKAWSNIEAELGHVAEGVRCIRAVQALALQHNVEMPITEAVAAILFGGEAPQYRVAQLLSRDAKGELAGAKSKCNIFFKENVACQKNTPIYR